MENKNLTLFRDFLDNYKKGMEIMGHGMNPDVDYRFKKFEEYITAFFDRAPFKVGDKVQITKDLNIKKDSGWYSCRHFLIPGAEGTVHEVDFADGLFNASVTWDDESRIPTSGKDKTPIPIKDRYYYRMWETDIAKVEGADNVQ